MKAKQIEEEDVEKVKVVAKEADYSIKSCISLVNTTEELSSEEKVEVFDVFKDAQNSVFMTVEPITHLICLRKEIVCLLTYIALLVYLVIFFPFFW